MNRNRFMNILGGKKSHNALFTNVFFRKIKASVGKNGVIVLLLLAIMSAISNAGTLTLSTSLARVGDRVSLTYKPDSAWQNRQNLYAIVYHYNEVSGDSDGEAIALTRRSDGMWTGNFATRAKDVYLMVKIFDKARYDDNEGNFWDLKITTDGSKAAQGANFRHAMTLLGSNPPEIARNADFVKALALLREELKLYPKNISAKVAEVALGYDLKDYSEDFYKNTLQTVTSQIFDTTRENDTRAMIRGLNAIGQSGKALELETAYKRRFPSSKIAEESLMQAIQAQTVPSWFISQAQDYQRRFPDSPTSSIMQSAAIATFAQINDLRGAARWLDTLNTLNRATAAAYNELAKYWCRLDTSEERGLKYAQKALEMAQRGQVNVKPSHLTDLEWSMGTQATLSDVYNTIGAIYTELKRPNDAFNTILTAFELTEGDLPAPAFSQLASIYMDRKQFSDAYNYASKGIIATGGDDVLLRWHRRAFDSLFKPKPDTALYSANLELLRDSAKKIVAAKQIKARLDRPFIPGTVFSTDRVPFDLASLKGVPTLVVFWTSWAEPCLKSMPFLNLLYKRYEESGRARVIVIDAWEDKGRDQFVAVRDYVARNPSLYFQIYVDNENVVARKYGVTGLPMRFYLDKNGRIQYKGSGFSDGLKLTQEIEETMQLLMSETFYSAQ